MRMKYPRVLLHRVQVSGIGTEFGFGLAPCYTWYNICGKDSHGRPLHNTSLTIRHPPHKSDALILSRQHDAVCCAHSEHD